MISLLYPAMWGALIPVIIIETMILKRRRRLKLRSALGAVALANFVSTLVGIPLSWLLYGVLSILISIPLRWITDYPNYHTGGQSVPQIIVEPIISAAWIGPGQSDPLWLAPASLMCLLVTAFVMTVIIETPLIGSVLRQFGAEIPTKPWKDVIVANATSYAALEAVLAVLTLNGLMWVYG